MQRCALSYTYLVWSHAFLLFYLKVRKLWNKLNRHNSCGFSVLSPCCFLLQWSKSAPRTLKCAGASQSARNEKKNRGNEIEPQMDMVGCRVAASPVLIGPIIRQTQRTAEGTRGVLGERYMLLIGAMDGFQWKWCGGCALPLEGRKVQLWAAKSKMTGLVLDCHSC